MDFAHVREMRERRRFMKLLVDIVLEGVVDLDTLRLNGRIFRHLRSGGYCGIVREPDLLRHFLIMTDCCQFRSMHERMRLFVREDTPLAKNNGRTVNAYRPFRRVL